MRLEEIVRRLDLKALNEVDGAVEVSSGYTSDLLSDVLAKAKNGTLWATNQKHQNIIGVAVMLNLAGVIITGGIDPDENTLEKAKQENVPLYITNMSSFDVAGKLYKMGLRSA